MWFIVDFLVLLCWKEMVMMYGWFVLWIICYVIYSMVMIGSVFGGNGSNLVIYNECFCCYCFIWYLVVS